MLIKSCHASSEINPPLSANSEKNVQGTVVKPHDKAITLSRRKSVTAPQRDHTNCSIVEPLDMLRRRLSASLHDDTLQTAIEAS